MNKCEQTLSLEERESLITSYPLFCLLQPQEVKTLAASFDEVSAELGDTITKQDTMVDSVFLIANGSANVERTISTVEGVQIIPVAKLKKGDAIGLSEKGLYSQAGTRTAQVTAATPMTLLTLGINEFYTFLQKPAVAYPALKNMTEKILLMQFIQGSHIFEHLKKDEVQQLAHDIKKIQIKKDDILFHEGDDADACYFILSGQVAINAIQNGQNKTLITLSASNLFGEASLLEKGHRNATAVALEDSELFIIDKSQLHFLNKDDTLHEHIDEHRIQQIRPIKNNAMDDSIENVNVLNGIAVSRIENIIWGNINENYTLGELLNRYKETIPKLTMKELYETALMMKAKGLITFQDETMKPQRGIKFLFKSMLKKLSLSKGKA
ncbi:MAG: cyclic nucleotide-binding domain-containing protein [Gammaproteobacteria bacterium]